MKGYKIRLLPTKEQEKLFWKSIDASRYVYNWALELRMSKFKQNLSNTCIASSELTKHKKEAVWLNEISSATLMQSLIDLEEAYKIYLKTKDKKYLRSSIRKANTSDYVLSIYDVEYHPRFKSKKYSKPSFYTRNNRMYFIGNRVKLEKIGRVRYVSNREIPDVKYSNPRVSFDGKYWYLSFSVTRDSENQTVELTGETLGIDVGVNFLAVASNGMMFKSINKTAKVKKLTKRLKQKQRRFSKKGDGNNRLKLKNTILLMNRKLNNIRKTYRHVVSRQIVNTLPSKIILEDLNIQGMTRNKHIGVAILNQGWRYFFNNIEYKAKWLGIEVEKADRFFPSSKTCSSCGKIKKSFPAKFRTYNCECGLVLDRDLNASINLAKYTRK